MRIKHDSINFRFNMYNDENEHIGELDYRVGDDGDWYAEHTGIRSQYEGKGYAAQLVDAMVQAAEEQCVKIIPVCSYVKRAFQNHPDKYASVIK